MGKLSQGRERRDTDMLVLQDIWAIDKVGQRLQPSLMAFFGAGKDVLSKSLESGINHTQCNRWCLRTEGSRLKRNQ